MLAALLLGKTAQANERGVELVVSEDSRLDDGLLPPSLPARDLVTILGNLIDNAVDAAQGSVGARVTVTAYAEDGELVLRVSDTGAGVDPALAEAVFQRGFTTKPSGPGGRGLGLALVRQAATRHQGALSVAEADSGGAVFEVRLPLVEGSGAKEGGVSAEGSVPVEGVGAVEEAVPAERDDAKEDSAPAEGAGARQDSIPAERAGAEEGAAPAERADARQDSIPAERAGAEEGAAPAERADAKKDSVPVEGAGAEEDSVPAEKADAAEGADGKGASVSGAGPVPAGKPVPAEGAAGEGTVVSRGDV